MLSMRVLRRDTSGACRHDSAAAACRRRQAKGPLLPQAQITSFRHSSIQQAAAHPYNLQCDRQEGYTSLQPPVKVALGVWRLCRRAGSRHCGGRAASGAGARGAASATSQQVTSQYWPWYV